MITTDEELEIENTIVKLAKLLDQQYNVDDEFYTVIITAVNRHIELIEESE